MHKMQMVATNLEVFISIGLREYCIDPHLFLGVLHEPSTSNASFSSMAVKGCQSRVVFSPHNLPVPKEPSCVPFTCMIVLVDS